MKRSSGILLLLSLLGCDGGGSLPASASVIATVCSHACQCAVEEGLFTPIDKAGCVADCTANATEARVSAACFDCIGGLACEQLFTSDGRCTPQCSEPEQQPEPDAGTGPLLSPL